MIQHKPLSPRWISILSLWAEGLNQWSGSLITTHISHLQPPHPTPVNYLSFPRVCLVLTQAWIAFLIACQEDCGVSREDMLSEGGSVSLDLSLTCRSWNQSCCVVSGESCRIQAEAAELGTRRAAAGSFSHLTLICPIYYHHQNTLVSVWC